MLTLTLRGVVRELETGIGLAGFRVTPLDRRGRFGEVLGTAFTGEGGTFEIVGRGDGLDPLLDERPDLYLTVSSPAGDRQVYTTETPVRWDGWRVADFEVAVPRDALGDLARPRYVRFHADDGLPRDTFDVGEPLLIEVSGVKRTSPVDVTLSDHSGFLFTTRLLSDRYGSIRPTVIWPQIGLDDPRSGRRLGIDDALALWRGQTLAVTVRQDDSLRIESAIRFADDCRRPLLLATDRDGLPLGGVVAGTHDVFVSGWNFPSASVRIYLVAAQNQWWPGDRITPASLANGAPAVLELDVAKDERSFRAHLVDAAQLLPGAYDLIARIARYGYEEDEGYHLLPLDIVCFRNVKGLVVRLEFMASKAVRGGCVNVMPMGGRNIAGVPYFQFADTFQVGDDIYAALDPAAIDPAHQGKMAALYVIEHPVPQTSVTSGGLTITLPWDRKLHHLPVLGGNSAVQTFKTQAGCINLNTRLVWSNAQQEGEYDLVADFGNNSTNAVLFQPDAHFDPPLDIIDGYFKPGFRVVSDPTVSTEFPYAGTFDYGIVSYGTYADVDWQIVGSAYTSVPVSFLVPLRGRVFFPADVGGATTAAQLSTKKAAYDVVVFVHGQGQNFQSYDNLLEHFARNGFIAVAIHCESGMGGMSRARLLFDHLPVLKQMFGVRMLPIIGLMGHSRGGEAVVLATRLNQEQGLGWFINAVVSLAPTSAYFYQQSQGALSGPPSSLEGLWAAPYLVIYGGMDEDVHGPQATGFALYDRSRDARRCMVFVYGATHNGFAGGAPNFQNPTALGSSIKTLGQLTDKASLLTPATQELITKAYAMAFFRQHLYGDTRWADIFRGEWMPAAVRKAEYGKARLYMQYAEHADSVFPSAGALAIDTFEGAHTATSWQTSTIGGTVTDDGSLPVNTSGSPPNPAEDQLFAVDAKSPHQTSGLLVRWDGIGDRLRFTIPAAYKDVSKMMAISFRISQKADSAANPTGKAADLYVTLADTAGKSRAVRVSAFAEIPFPQVREVADYTKSAMRTVRIPLHVFSTEVFNLDPVDLANVASVQFSFDMSATGEIDLDSIEFVI